MTSPIRLLVLLVSIWIAGSVTGGCVRSPETDRSRPDQHASNPLALPNLSTTEKSVRQQIVQAYETLMMEINAAAASPSSRGAAYGAVGQLLMAAEMYDAAESFLRTATTLAPGEPRWPYYLAHVYRTKNDLESAVKLFERTTELAPSYEAASAWSGFIYLDLDRLADAEAQFAEAYDLNPQSAAALFGRGRVALMKRDYAGAAENFEAALRVDPEAGVIHFPLATAYRAMGQNAKADTQLRLWRDRNVGMRDPFLDEVGEALQSSLAYELRGDREIRREQWASAVSYYRKSVELAADNAERRHKLGTAMLAAGDTAGASEQFRRALELAPRLAKVHLSMGIISQLRGSHGDAIEHFREGVRSDPSDLEAQLLLADALRISGSANESLRHYENALKMNPRVPRAKYGYAMALLKAQRYGEARIQLSEGVQLYPEHRQFADALTQLR